MQLVDVDRAEPRVACPVLERLHARRLGEIQQLGLRARHRELGLGDHRRLIERDLTRHHRVLGGGALLDRPGGVDGHLGLRRRGSRRTCEPLRRVGEALGPIRATISGARRQPRRRSQRRVPRDRQLFGQRRAVSSGVVVGAQRNESLPQLPGRFPHTQSHGLASPPHRLPLRGGPSSRSPRSFRPCDASVSNVCSRPVTTALRSHDDCRQDEPPRRNGSSTYALPWPPPSQHTS